MARNPTLSNTSTAAGGALRAVTPTADADLPDGHCRALFVGTGGNIAVVAVEDAEPVLLKNVASGAIVQVRTKAVRSVGTTAADIVAIY
jgi:hypothetical protein